MRVGYWVDLNKFQLSDGMDPIWIHAFPYGSYQHPLYGKLTMDKARAERMASNVKQRVRGIDIDIDYDHKALSGKAAGWVRDADVRTDGLWLLVEWTAPARASLRNKEYRYFSPEYVDKWTHPSTGAAHQDVLFGGAITNRPFLKDILPINMSELDGGEQVNEFLEKLRSKLGLPEDATEEQILAAFELVEEPPEDEEETETETETEETETEVEEPTADEAKVIAAMEKSPLMKRLMDTIDTQNKTLAEIQKDRKEEGARKTLSEMINGKTNGKFALPPAAEEDLVKALSEGDVTSFTAGLEKIMETGLVELGERGGRRPADGKSATEIVNEKMVKLTEGENGMSVPDAIERLTLEEPDLYEAYRREAMQKESA
jgi:phage I-like protein